MRDAQKGLAGVSEFTTAAAAQFARDAERLGAAGLMVLPAMVYVPTPAELEHHFRTVAAATGLPIMLYNNPPSYRVNIDIPTLNRLANVPNIVSLKESAPDSRRFTDILNAFGELNLGAKYYFDFGFTTNPGANQDYNQ